jgi:signal peptidase II
MPRVDLRLLRWLYFLITVSLLVTADQISKAWIRIYPEGSIIFQRGIFRIVHIENSGAAFGIFRDHSDILMAVDFTALAAIMVYLLFFQKRFPLPNFRTGWMALLLIFTGTLGNLIDRLNPALGGITDFVYIGPWPAFNVADSCLTVGCILLAASLVFVQDKSKVGQRNVSGKG